MSSGREVTSVNEYPTADGNVGAAGGRDVLYAQVCPLDLPYRAARLFDYKIPAELHGAVRAGDFVTVPFGQGNRPCTALVMGVSDTPSPREGGCRPRYKEICDLLGSELHLSEEFLGLVQYMQEHLFCSIGEAVYAIIPAFMLGRADREYMLTERGRALVDGMNAVSGGVMRRTRLMQLIRLMQLLRLPRPNGGRLRCSCRRERAREPCVSRRSRSNRCAAHLPDLKIRAAQYRLSLLSG